MTTFYKPSQWRGKRLLYRSSDPDEPKQEMRKLIVFLVALILSLAIVWFAIGCAK